MTFSEIFQFIGGGNVVSSTPRLSRVRTHNFSGDRHWMHK